MDTISTAQKVNKILIQKSNPAKAAHLQRFFKTGRGEYAEGDVFIGVTVPEQRKIAKLFSNLSLNETIVLLHSKIHEERLVALLILVDQYKKGNEQKKEEIYKFYVNNTAYVNNWDLVDTSAEYIVGPWLEIRDKSFLLELSQSHLLWERRIAMLACFHYIKKGNATWALKVAEQLLRDKEDLIHKAVGWMLREIGKRCSQAEEEAFLEQNYAKMPRTMLRYAIERFEEGKRQFWLKRK